MDRINGFDIKILNISQNKKGFTLVEVLASTIILALISMGIIFTLTFSHNMVQANSTDDAYAAEVQSAADAIMSLVNGGYTTAGEIQTASQTSGEYLYLDASSGFDPALDKIQFQIAPTVEDSTLHKITVRLYYGFSNDRNNVEMICYSHADW